MTKERPPTKLAESTMSPFELLAQSLAGIAPSAVMATGPALVALGAGNSIMYSYIVSTIILLMVGWCINEFAKRSGSEATPLSYIKSVLGPVVGYLGAVGLAFGYALIAMGSMGGFALYSGSLLDAVGVPNAFGKGITILLFALCIVLAGYAMIGGVRLSTRLGVVLEAISVVAILVVIVAVLAKNGLASAPFHPAGFTSHGVTSGMVLAILGYVGFESAACMGVEAKDPHRSVPKAVIGSLVIASILYLLSAYTQLVGFKGGEGITKSAAPFNDLADSAGVHLLGYLIDLGAALSFFACVTGSINAASRLAFSLAEEGLLHRSIADAHARKQTPHIAILALCAASFLTVSAMTLYGTSALNVFAYLGTIGTYGYMIAYIMIAVGAPIFLFRLKASSFAITTLLGALAAIGMGYVLLKSVYPAPASPYNVLPWIFLAVLVVAGAWYAVVKVRTGRDMTVVSDDAVEAVDAVA